ncbi:MAG: alpha/beta fold hydrolase [Chloroflexota bacterium]|nr:alpha/beta fold hydrolase [Chloroflexota bacterium]
MSAWKRQLIAGGSNLFINQNGARREREQEALQSELYDQIGRLKMELEWLKKKLPDSIEAKRSLIERNHPRITAPVPCIVMAHGLGGTKAMGLDRYETRFQAAGFAVLAFDYRFWGESAGEPRGLIWIPHQLEDYAAAVRYARSRGEIDPERIALWGTSMSGGHVVVTAAQDHRIACMAAQCPGLDGLVSAKKTYSRAGVDLRIAVHAQRDLARSWLGLLPHKIPVVGKPGNVALMTTPDAMDAFEQFIPPGYINEACARTAIRGDKYRPIKQAHEIRCPTLLQICEKDDLLPAGAVEETAMILGDLAELQRYPIGHFDVYMGENFEASVADQMAFFERNLSRT